MKKLVFLCVLSLAFVIVSCGSGGSGGSAADTTAPSVPSGLTSSSVTSSSVIISWNGSSDDVAVAGYKIYRNGTFNQSVSITNCSDTGLLASTTHCYTVAAYDTSGNESEHSNQACITTLPASDDIQDPTTPTGLTATAASSSLIDISWTASSDNVGVTGYKVYSGAGTYLKSVTATSTSMTGLSASTQYCYMVSAYDAAGNESVKSGQQCATTQVSLDIQDPTTPTGLTATAASSSQVDISWTASSDNVDVTGYKVYSGAGTYLKSVTATSTSMTGLSASTQYCYMVSAYDAAGNESVKTAQKCATTTAASVCTSSQTRCVAGNIEAVETCNGSGTAWVQSSCPTWKLCSHSACRTICDITATPANPTICMVPNKDGVNNGEWLTYYDNKLVVPTYVTGQSVLSTYANAPIYSSGTTWPYAWSIGTNDAIEMNFKLNQFGYRHPSLGFKAKRSGIINDGTNRYSVGVFSGSTLIGSCVWGPVPYLWGADYCQVGTNYTQLNYSGGWNSMMLSIVGNGLIPPSSPDLLEVNYVYLRMDP